MTRGRSTHPKRFLAVVLLLGAGLYALAAAEHGTPTARSGMEFTDVQKHTMDFMAYNRSIHLTPEQQVIFQSALSALPAPCCSDETALACCCECNMAKAWWGLAKQLIADMGCDHDQAQTIVARWFEFINPDGFTGNACYTGGCNRPFRAKGCGGMKEENVVF